jgi:hypothetical protein
MHRRTTLGLLAAVIFVFMTACNLPFALPGDVTDMMPEPEVVTAVPYMECSWQWAYQDQPDLQAALETALTDAGIAYDSVSVYAYGENCVDAQGEVQQYAAMETDFDLALLIEDLDDRAALADRLAEVLTLLVNEFPVSATPGPQPGYFSLMFLAGTDTLTVYVQQNTAVELVRQSVTGEALLEALDVAHGLE